MMILRFRVRTVFACGDAPTPRMDEEVRVGATTVARAAGEAAETWWREVAAAAALREAVIAAITAWGGAMPDAVLAPRGPCLRQ